MSGKFHISDIISPEDIPIILAYFVFLAAILLIITGLKGYHKGKYVYGIAQCVIGLFMCFGLISAIYYVSNKDSSD